MMRDFIATYRELVAADESLRHLRESLALVEAVVGIDISLARGRVTVRRRPDAAWIAHDESDRTEQAIRAALGEVNGSSLSRKEAESYALAVGLLPLAICASVEPGIDARRAALLLDSALVVVHQAYHVLLPVLEVSTGPEPRHRLLKAIVAFANALSDPGDRAHLLALCGEAAGDVEGAARHHREAVRATPSDAHNFLTLLQLHWTFLTEHERFEDALEVLLEAYPRVCRADLDEVGALIRTTFELSSRNAMARVGV